MVPLLERNHRYQAEKSDWDTLNVEQSIGPVDKAPPTRNQRFKVYKVKFNPDVLLSFPSYLFIKVGLDTEVKFVCLVY